MGIVLRQAWSESQWTVSMRWQLFLSGRQRTGALCVTQSNAEAQVTWGGIVKRVLIVYFIGNISAKKLSKSIHYVKVIARQRWDIFWDTVYFRTVVSSFILFFLAYSQPSQIGCLPYFHTWCGLSANLECRSEMCCTRLAKNAGRKSCQKFAVCAP